MKRYRRILAGVLFFCAVAIASGCSYGSRFTPPMHQETSLVLKENDFQISAINREGYAEVWYLFGLIPMGDERLFSRALADLYRPIEKQTVGRPTQLVNWTYEDTTLNLFLVSKREVVFRADLLEFTK